MNKRKINDWAKIAVVRYVADQKKHSAKDIPIESEDVTVVASTYAGGQATLVLMTKTPTIRYYIYQYNPDEQKELLTVCAHVASRKYSVLSV